MDHKHDLTVFSIGLLVLAIFLIVCSIIPNNFTNLELNLGTEFAGIFLTITVIDWILKRNNKIKWENSEKLLLKKVKKINNKFNASIRTFNGTTITFPDVEASEENIIRFNISLLEQTEQIIIPQLQRTITSIDSDRWKELFNNLKELNQYLIQTVLLFGEKIEPEIHSDLLIIQIFLEEKIELYSAVPEMFLYEPSRFTVQQLNDSVFLKNKFANELITPLNTAISMNKKLLTNN